MIVKTFEDGSEMTMKHVAAIGVVGALGAVTVVVVQNAWYNWTIKRTMKKYGWPQDAVDNV